MKQEKDKSKKSYLEWYENDKEVRKKIKKSPVFFYIILLPVFLLGAFRLSLEKMGEQALTYSEQVYQNIRTVMDESLTPGIGIDSKILQEGCDLIEERTGHIDHYEGVDQYVEKYNENGHSLEATIKNGYFEATVTAVLDKDFNVIATRKNFETTKDYMQHFKQDLEWYTFGYGIAAWIALGIAWEIFTGAIASLCRFKNKKKEEMEKQTLEDQAESETLENKEEEKEDKIEETPVTNSI